MSALGKVEFNGLSQDAFEHGMQVLDVIEDTDNDTLREVVPHIIEHLKIRLLNSYTSPDQARAEAALFRSAGRALELHANTLEERQRPFEPRPEDE